MNATTLYQKADYRTAHDALITAIREEKNYIADYPDYRKYLISDIGADYARLALLEESVGHSETARKYMSEASKAMCDSGWRSCSEEEVRNFIMRLDKWTPRRKE